MEFKRSHRSLHSIFISFIGLLCVLISYSFWKLIWFDEVLQFAIASYDSSGTALQVFLSTTGGTNHGQTGAYFLADYFLLNWFGASELWLRLPSIFSGFWLFLSAQKLYKQWRLPSYWQVFGMLLLFTNHWIMDFVSEARPYLPLAAFSVGTFAYYHISIENRKKWQNYIWGYASVLGGCVFHPYFCLYWVFSIFIGYFFLKYVKKEHTPILKHLDPVLVCVGTIVYFYIAFSTWLGHMPKHGLDPFYFVPKNHWFPRRVVSIHFESLAKLKTPFVLALLFSGIGIFYYSTFKKLKNKFIYTYFLIGGSLSITALLVYLSYKSPYWILERQWIASIAFVLIGSTFFAYLFSKVIPKKLNIIWMIILFSWIAWHSLSVASTHIQRNFAYFKNKTPTTIQEPSTPPQTNGEWESLARMNCDQGGPVWKIFQYYYKPININSLHD